jgi:hypothetical protein
MSVRIVVISSLSFRPRQCDAILIAFANHSALIMSSPVGVGKLLLRINIISRFNNHALGSYGLYYITWLEHGDVTSTDVCKLTQVHPVYTGRIISGNHGSFKFLTYQFALCHEVG